MANRSKSETTQTSLLAQLIESAHALNSNTERHKAYQDLATYMDPQVGIIGCMDSRVHPCEILGYKPGDAFEWRNAGNMVDISKSRHSSGGVPAGVEFAVKGKQVKDIIVMGHSNCGAIRGLVTQPASLPNVKRWVKRYCGLSAKAQTALNEQFQTIAVSEHELFLDNVSQANVKQQVKRLNAFLQDIGKSDVNVHGWFFDLNTSTLSALDTKSNQFVPLAEARELATAGKK